MLTSFRGGKRTVSLTTGDRKSLASSAALLTEFATQAGCDHALVAAEAIQTTLGLFPAKAKKTPAVTGADPTWTTK